VRWRRGQLFAGVHVTGDDAMAWRPSLQPRCNAVRSDGMWLAACEAVQMFKCWDMRLTYGR